MKSEHERLGKDLIGACVEIEHQQSKIRTTLAVAEHYNDLLWLRWPLAGLICFRKSTGEGMKDATAWKLTENGRATLRLPPEVKREAAKPRAKRPPKVTDAQARTSCMFCGRVGCINQGAC